MSLNYEEDVRINPNGLDIDWLEQPRLMLQYAKNQAECRHVIDLLTEELSIIRAELDSEIRSEPGDYGLTKATNEAVNNIIVQNKRYSKKNKELLRAKFDYEIAKAAVQAMEHRKSALENLVKLFGQQYFAGPNIPRNLTKEWEEEQIQKSSNKKIKIGRRK